MAAAAQAVGHDASTLDLAQAIQTPQAKTRLRTETEAALAAGVWGTPSCVVDGEVFWGADCLPLLDDWLQRGGW